MKRLMWVLVSAFFAIGCRPTAPKDIIKADTMEKILYDMHIVDGYLSTIYVPDSVKKVGSAYYKGIYEKYNTDSVQYSKSLNYYYANPDELNKMYKNITKQIEKQKKGTAMADSLIKRKAFVLDSVKLAKKFKADTAEIHKKIKPTAASKAKADAEIAKKKNELDSILKIKNAVSTLTLSKSMRKKFTADSLSIRKKMKLDSASNAQAKQQISKKKKELDSVLNLKKGQLPVSLAH